jgi:hypothetical protein
MNVNIHKNSCKILIHKLRQMAEKGFCFCLLRSNGESMSIPDPQAF